MKCYRVCKEKYSSDLSGTGAFLAGARWNSKGTHMLYAAESRALAMSEVVVHLSINQMPEDLVIIEISIPDDKIEEIDPVTLEGIAWKTIPPGNETQKIGDKFISDTTILALRVPSVVVEGDFNLIINPRHPDFRKSVTIVEKKPFPIDPRLLIGNGHNS